MNIFEEMDQQGDGELPIDIIIQRFLEHMQIESFLEDDFTYNKHGHANKSPGFLRHLRSNIAHHNNDDNNDDDSDDSDDNDSSSCSSSSSRFPRPGPDLVYVSLAFEQKVRIFKLRAETDMFSR